MKAEFTAIIEPAPEGGYWAICPECLTYIWVDENQVASEARCAVFDFLELVRHFPALLTLVLG